MTTIRTMHQRPKILVDHDDPRRARTAGMSDPHHTSAARWWAGAT